MKMKQQDFSLDILIRRSSISIFLICTVLGGFAGAATMLFPATYEARGKILLSSTWIEKEEFQRVFSDTASLRKLEHDIYLGKRNNLFVLPKDMELLLRTDSAQAAYTQLADIMQGIKTEIRQNLTMKYQAEAAALDKLSKQSAKQASDLNIRVGSRVGERQIAVDLVLSELSSEKKLILVWLKEPIVHFPKPNVVIGAGLLSGAIIGTFFNLIGGLGRRKSFRH